MSKKTIFVGGLSPNTRTADLARNFDRYGKLVRCDIPTPGGRPKGYAFVEFEDDRDADEAFEAMKCRRLSTAEKFLYSGRSVTQLRVGALLRHTGVLRPQREREEGMITF